FDRPINVETFDTTDVTIRYRDVNTPASAPGVVIPIISVEPLDGTSAATQFLVRFNPQAGVGTYSYTIGPDIRDVFRSVQTIVTPLQTITVNAPPSEVNKTIPPG